MKKKKLKFLIKEFLKKEEINAPAFAKKIKVSKQCVYAWEQNLNFPSLNNVEKICNKFNCSINELLELQEESNNV